MTPYSRLNTTIKSCPMGLPLAVKISEVTPMREAQRVSVLPRSKTRKDRKINRVEMPHKNRSVREK